jgi:hypothetical protein
MEGGRKEGRKEGRMMEMREEGCLNRKEGNSSAGPDGLGYLQVRGSWGRKMKFNMSRPSTTFNLNLIVRFISSSWSTAFGDVFDGSFNHFLLVRALEARPDDFTISLLDLDSLKLSSKR